jgi:hypothetical protein
MALETRHTEKQMLFNLLMAMYREPALKDSRELNFVIKSLKAVMEPEDVAVVLEQIIALDN